MNRRNRIAGPHLLAFVDVDLDEFMDGLLEVERGHDREVDRPA